MKKVTCFLILIFAFSSIQAQIIFTKGYIIDKAHVRTECFIRNADWKNNPTDFKYKITEDGEVQTGNPETIEEFGIEGEFNYVGADVQIDMSSSSLITLTYSKEPEWSQQKIFLKVLVDGRFKLYRYESNKLVRYFYRVNDAPIAQLVNKTYYMDHPEKGKVVATNEYFKQQLWNDAKCEKISFEKTKNIHYLQNELIKFATIYNSCFDDFVKPEKKKREKLVSLSVVPGVAILEAYTNGAMDDFDFEKKTSIRLGIEGEITLPFNRNKTSVFIEAVYLSYSDAKENVDQVGPQYGAVDYTEIAASVGLRYYFFLGDKSKSKLYVNGLVVTPLTAVFDSSIRFKNFYLDAKPDIGFGAGIGYTYGRLSFETRYYSSKNIGNGAGGGVSTTLSNVQAMVKFRVARF